MEKAGCRTEQARQEHGIRVCLKKIVFRKGFRFIGQVKWPQAGAGTSGGMVVWTEDRFENAGRFFP